MKLLMIAPEPFFTPRGTPFSVYYRALVAAEQGASIDLLTYGEGDDVVIPGVRIVRIPRLPSSARSRSARPCRSSCSTSGCSSGRSASCSGIATTPSMRTRSRFSGANV